MRLRTLGLILALFLQSPEVQAKSECEGWHLVEETPHGSIFEHYHSHRSVQTIQINNYGQVYFLIAGPYGFDQIQLNGILPTRFPTRYLGKCCWLRRTKKGNKLLMTYGQDDPPDILLGN